MALSPEDQARLQARATVFAGLLQSRLAWERAYAAGAEHGIEPWNILVQYAKDIEALLGDDL